MISTRECWNKKWSEIFDQYQLDWRHAYYVRALKNNRETKLLEIGAGSFRDMAALNRWGISCMGVDYSAESVKRAKRLFPEIAEMVQQMNAFELAFATDAFDLTYHNGVWGYFSNEDILKLLNEQVRITKYRIIASVHNGHNEEFRLYFDRMAETDPLFNIRFFQVDEITALLSQACSKVTIVPVGKGKKHGEDKLIREDLGHPFLLKSYFSIMKLKYLNSSERLLCIGEV